MQGERTLGMGLGLLNRDHPPHLAMPRGRIRPAQELIRPSAPPLTSGLRWSVAATLGGAVRSKRPHSPERPHRRASTGFLSLALQPRFGIGFQTLLAAASAAAFLLKSATRSIIAAFTPAGAVFIEPALNGGSGSYSLMSCVHSA